MRGLTDGLSKEQASKLYEEIKTSESPAEEINKTLEVLIDGFKSMLEAWRQTLLQEDKDRIEKIMSKYRK